jgi:hypothetical protein
MNIKIDSTLRRQISAARLSEAERDVAMNAVRMAYVMVDAADWIVKKLEQFGTRTFMKPGFDAK